MKKPEKALALMLALALSAACAGPQPERGEEAGLPNDRNEQTGDFVSEARQALDELGDDFDELETRNARLQGENAEAWAESRDEIVRAREALNTDLERLDGASTENASTRSFIV